jgi:hypothetical protein
MEYQKWSIPRDLQLGHDPSLGGPMPDITALAVGRKQLRFAILSPDRKHRTASSHPLSHHQEQTQLIVLQCRSNIVSVCEELIVLLPARRYNDRSRVAESAKSMGISPSVSAYANQLLCGTLSAMTRADLVGTTLESTETFVSKTT